MHRPAPFAPFAAACAAVLAAQAASAQVYSQSDLVLGQLARLEVTGASLGDQAAFLISFAGTGAGPCFPSAGVCLGLLSPTTLLAILPVGSAGASAITALVPPAAPLVPVFGQAVVLSTASGAPTAVATNVDGGAIQTLAALSDDFEATALSADWSILNPGVAEVSVAGGELALRPEVGGPAVTWFEDGEGVLVYRNVTGDFTVSATVHAFDPANPGAPPPFPYRLGGLLARDPTSVPGDKNFVHVAVGGGDAAHPVAVEDKTTTASVSDFVLYAIGPEAAGEVRITRQGALISLWYRPDGSAPWQLLRSHAHPEFPATLQVGAMAYSNPLTPSIELRVEEIAFEP